MTAASAASDQEGSSGRVAQREPRSGSDGGGVGKALPGADLSGTA
ncbi:hypothetical protein [Streptomyces sp. NBC_00006]|nr:hypothetical protein [Streptomyces sp. NBC_00006]